MLYTERQKIAENICAKLERGEVLSPTELSYAREVLLDPLGEFCMREGTFRLVEMLDVDKAIASDLENEAYEIIRDTIDYSEILYDTMDEELHSIINKED